MARVTDPSKPAGAPDGAAPARSGPAGPEFAAYAKLPAPSRAALQLREVQAIARAFEAHLAKTLGCNPTDLAAMEHLIVSGPMSPGELSQRLGVTSAAGSMVVDRLAGLGHVERHPHAADRRRTVVHPTAASVTRAIDELVPVITGVSEIVASLTDAERATIEAFLDRVIGVYSAALAGEEAPVAGLAP